MTPARKCSATKTDGRPCQAWAMRESEPPLCAQHFEPSLPAETSIVTSKETSTEPSPDAPNKANLDFYSRSFSIEELTALINLALVSSLNGEVAASRIAIRRILQQLEEELSAAEYAQLAGLIFTGANTIARLLRAQRSLSGEAAEGIIGSLAKGLDEMSIEWRMDI